MFFAFTAVCVYEVSGVGVGCSGGGLVVCYSLKVAMKASGNLLRMDLRSFLASLSVFALP